MTQIDYYWFPLSPYCYLAGQRLEEIAAGCGARIVYKPFELLRVFSETGTAMPRDRHPARQAYRLRDLARLARYRDLPLNPQPAFWPTNAVPASAALIAAQKAGGGDPGALAHAINRAVWAEERDVAEDGVLRDCLKASGFDPALAGTDMLGSVETLQRNTEAALKAGIFGAPSYVVGDEVFWGQDRLDLLAAYLQGRL